jgi:hypothetical protein
MPALGSLNHDPSLAVPAPRLLVEQSARGARVAISNPPAFAAMGREALHLVAGLALTAALVILGLYLLRVNGGEWWYQGLVCLVVSGFVIAAVAAEAYRNCGIVTEIAVRDGDRVKTGDLLVRLDSTTAAANLAIITKGLDEPNSNLDAEGDAALSKAILAVRERGGIVVVVAHRPNTLESVDMALTMMDGGVVAFGPKEEVFRKVLRPSIVPVPKAGVAS